MCIRKSNKKQESRTCLIPLVFALEKISWDARLHRILFAVSDTF